MFDCSFSFSFFFFYLVSRFLFHSSISPFATLQPCHVLGIEEARIFFHFHIGSFLGPTGGNGIRRMELGYVGCIIWIYTMSSTHRLLQTGRRMLLTQRYWSNISTAREGKSIKQHYLTAMRLQDAFGVGVHVRRSLSPPYVCTSRKPGIQWGYTT